MNTVVDNDVLIKGACYRLLAQFIEAASAEDVVGVLGAARFVVPKQIAKKCPRRGPALPLADFTAFMQTCSILEPDLQERDLAAVLELAAQRAGLSLDAGESQLCAIVAVRSLASLVTGDKRAIRAAESVLDAEQRFANLAGKLRCLEQIVLTLLTGVRSREDLRAAICGEPAIDTALTICFACFSADPPAGAVTAGINSYIRALRSDAPRVLAP